MKPTSNLLDRLFQAASAAPQMEAEPPRGLEGRIVAVWQARTGEQRSFEMLAIFRHALVFAVALVCLIGALDFLAPARASDPATGFANSTFLAAIDR